MKIVANDIFGAFNRFKRGECTYDRALEDASNIMNKYADERPIVGYVKSGTVGRIFFEILDKSKPDSDKNYIFNCQIHKSTIDDIRRIQNSMCSY